MLDKFHLRELVFESAMRTASVNAVEVAFEAPGEPDGGNNDEPAFLLEGGLISAGAYRRLIAKKQKTLHGTGARPLYLCVLISAQI